jgi:hypothetical protein
MSLVIIAPALEIKREKIDQMRPVYVYRNFLQEMYEGLRRSVRNPIGVLF